MQAASDVMVPRNGPGVGINGCRGRTKLKPRG
jgi:hypothetical protein